MEVHCFPQALNDKNRNWIHSGHYDRRVNCIKYIGRGKVYCNWYREYFGLLRLAEATSGGLEYKFITSRSAEPQISPGCLCCPRRPSRYPDPLVAQPSLKAGVQSRLRQIVCYNEMSIWHKGFFTVRDTYTAVSSRLSCSQGSTVLECLSSSKSCGYAYPFSLNDEEVAKDCLEGDPDDVDDLL